MLVLLKSLVQRWLRLTEALLGPREVWAVITGFGPFCLNGTTSLEQLINKRGDIMETFPGWTETKRFGVWSWRSAASVTCFHTSMLSALTSREGQMNLSYRLWLPHIDGWADGCWLALSSPVHFFHHTVHVASREAMEKHRCRRGENIITVLFGSASQDVHERQAKKKKKNPPQIMPLTVVAFEGFPFSLWQVRNPVQGGKNMRKKLDTCSPHYVSSANGNRHPNLCSSLSVLISYD